MTKILFEGSIFLHQKIGGISNYIVELNERLKKHNVNSKIISMFSINEYLAEKSSNKVSFFKIKKIPKFCRKIFFYLNDLFLLLYIKIYKPDLVHFSYYNGKLIPRLKVPYVVTIYDLIHEKLDLNDKQFPKSEMLDKAEHIICISNTTKNDLIERYNVDQKKVSTIFLGVNNTNIYKEKKEKYILYVGDRKGYKNFESIVKAFGNSSFLKKNYKLICFGGDKFSSKEKLFFDKIGIKKNLFQESGNDQYLKKFYESASLFVNTSLIEGFGLTNLEAMSYGCPVLCSEIPIFREILGNSCEYVEPKNIEIIQKKIEKILKSQNEQKRLIRLGFNKISNYSWENCVLSTSKIYEKIISEK
tara:strand:- start:2458 stop:3534 length:1077 start_codon:yes stop_codon:yes gene_type:complete